MAKAKDSIGDIPAGFPNNYYIAGIVPVSGSV